MGSDVMAPSAPRDAGLSGLSLVMQFTGRFMFWLALTYVLPLFPLLGGGAGWWMLPLVGTSALRSYLHRKAGVAVIANDPRPVRHYLFFSAIQTAGLAFAVGVVGGAFGLAFAVVVLLGWWPLMVWALVRRADRLLADQLAPEQRLPSDRGLTGLALSMVVLASICALLTAAVLVYWRKFLGPLPFFWRMWLMVGCVFGLSVVRSLFHFWTAGTLLRRFDLPRFFRARERYFSVSVVASLATVLVLAVSGTQIALLVGTLPHLGVVLAWPLIVRDFGVGTSGPADPNPQGLTRPADGGLGTLAVLLLASGGLGLALWFMGGVLNPAAEPTYAMLARGMGGGAGGWLKTALFTEPALLWCGGCLLTGHARRKQAAWLALGLAAVAGVVEVALWLKQPSGILLGFGPLPNAPEFLAAKVLIPLVLPLVVLWQLRRVAREPVPPPAESPPPETPRIDLAKG